MTEPREMLSLGWLRERVALSTIESALEPVCQRADSSVIGPAPINPIADPDVRSFLVVGPPHHGQLELMPMHGLAQAASTSSNQSFITCM